MRRERSKKRSPLPRGRSVRRNVRDGQQPLATPPNQRPANARAGDEEIIAGRRLKAIQLRRARLTYRQIAKELGITVKTAWEDVQAEYEAERAATVEERKAALAEEIDHLDSIARVAVGQFRGGNVKAGFLLVKLSERRAKLMGWDAPVKVAPTTPEGEQPYQLVDPRALPVELIEQLMQATAGTGS